MGLCLSVCLSVTHTHLFNSPFSGTTQVSRYQKGDWQWHKLGHMQVCTSLQTDNHASTPPLSFFTGRMPFLPPNQQRQSTERPVSVCLSVCLSQVSVLLKCRDMQCLSTRRAAGQVTSRTHQCYGPVSVCLSVTSQCSTGKDLERLDDETYCLLSAVQLVASRYAERRFFILRQLTLSLVTGFVLG